MKAARRKSVDHPSDQRCTSPLSVVVAFCWKDVWHEHNMQKMVAGDNTVALVSPLKPATSYHFRVLAENHLGTSAPSDILHVSIKHFSISQRNKKKKKKKQKKAIFIILSHYVHLFVRLEHDRHRRFTFLHVSLSTRSTPTPFDRIKYDRIDGNQRRDNRPKRTARSPADHRGTLSPSP